MRSNKWGRWLTSLSNKFNDTHEDAKPGQRQHARIEKLEDFHIDSLEPPAFRPFKPKYHLTMGMHLLVFRRHI